MGLKQIRETAETVFQGRMLQVEAVTIEYPSGQTWHKERIRWGNSVVILPQLPTGEILFVGQYRIGVEASVLELPSGMIDLGETPEEAALRELAEETGWQAEARTLRHLWSGYLCPGYCDELCTAFVARPQTRRTARAEDTERIDRLTLSEAEVRSALREGRLFRDVKTLAALWSFLGSL